MDEVAKTCEVCGTPFSVAWKFRAQKLCSAKCRGVRNAQMFRSFSPETKAKATKNRADAVRGTGSKSAYVKRNGRHEHRLVMEQALGRALTYDDVVHHKDENPRNNALDNLQLTTRPEHARIHKCFSKNRHLWTTETAPRGSQCKHAKLTEATVKEVRERYASGGVSLTQLATIYNVNRNAIWFAIRRKTWKHVP